MCTAALILSKVGCDRRLCAPELQLHDRTSFSGRNSWSDGTSFTVNVKHQCSIWHTFGLSHISFRFNRARPSVESLFLTRPAGHLSQQISIVIITVGHWFSNCGTRTTSGTRGLFRWYASSFPIIFKKLC